MCFEIRNIFFGWFFNIFGDWDCWSIQMRWLPEIAYVFCDLQLSNKLVHHCKWIDWFLLFIFNKIWMIHPQSFRSIQLITVIANYVRNNFHLDFCLQRMLRDAGRFLQQPVLRRAFFATTGRVMTCRYFYWSFIVSGDFSRPKAKQDSVLCGDWNGYEVVNYLDDFQTFDC